MSEREAIYYDPYDYEIDAHPHPMWKRMRDEAPLYYNEKYDFFAVSRYQNVREISADWRSYSSARGSVLELIDSPPEVLEVARNMLFEDPPIHDEHRSILARSFTPPRISDLEVEIRKLCHSLLDAVDGSSFDFVRDYGGKVPTVVIGMLLGVPEADREQLRSWADELVHRDEGDTEYNERAYADPDHFDVRREFSNNHVSFGHGIHFCLGAALARLEGTIGITEMLARFPAWEVDEAEAEMVHTSTVRGWASLPVSAAQ